MRYAVRSQARQGCSGVFQRNRHLRADPLRWVCVALAAGMLAPAGLRALRVASIFDWKDMRLVAERWIRRHEPPHSSFALARYADVNPHGEAMAVHSVSLDGIDALRERGADYALTAAGPGGRGMIDPITVQMYPRYQAVFKRFREESQRLHTWSLLPPRSTWTSFNSVDLDLYALQPAPAGANLDVALPYPVLTGDEDHKTVLPDDDRLGAVNGSRLNRDIRRIAFAARGGFAQPCYALVYTEEREASVKLRGFGRRHRADLAPYDLAVLALDRPAWLPRAGHIEIVHASARSREDVQPIPCFLHPAFSAAAAARTALTLNRAHRLPEAILNSPDLPDLLRYQLAVRRRQWDAADAAAAGAAAEAGTLQRALAETNGAFCVQGIALAQLRAFARVRFGQHRCALGQPAPDRPATGQLRLPTRVAAGRYTLSFTTRPVDGDAFPNGPLTFHIGQANVTTRHVQPAATGRTRVDLAFRAGGEEPLILLVAATAPGTVGLDDVVLSWDPADQLADIHTSYRLDRAAQLLQRGAAPEALDLLAALHPPLRRRHEIRRRRLVFRGRRAAGALDADRRAAALALLEAAPGHIEAASGPEAPELAALAEVPACTPLVFQDLVALRRFRYHPELRTAVCVFECLRNDIPRLTATVLYRKHFKWRRKRIHAKPLRHHPVLTRGEWVRVVVPLTDAVPDPNNLSALALCVEADLAWAPGRLNIAGREHNAVRFDRLQPAEDG